jgi:WD40-like Beta Propeller Repeat
MKINYLVPTLLLILFASGCKKDTDSKSAELTKIYFNGYDPNIGASGITWSEIYSINPDGSDLTQITNFSNNGTKNIRTIEPCFNYDTSRIAYGSNKDIFDPYFGLYSMNFDGTSAFRVASGSLYSECFHSSGYKEFTQVAQYLFESRKFNGTNYYGVISSIHEDGFVGTLHTTYPSDGDCREPFAVKPFIKVLYTSDKTGAREIYIMDNYGANKRQLTFDGLQKSNPRSSPDATKIVFVSKLNSGTIDHSEIFIMNIDGSNILQLTNYSAGGTISKVTGSPVFSPDGQKIIYTSNESGNNQIYIMKIDGTEKQKLTSTNMKVFNPIAR